MAIGEKSGSLLTGVAARKEKNMGDGSTADFLRRLNEDNARIAAREAEEKTKKEEGVDQFRLQRDAERREKLGQLRARPRRRNKRPIQQVFGLHWDSGGSEV